MLPRGGAYRGRGAIIKPDFGSATSETSRLKEVDLEVLFRSGLQGPQRSLQGDVAVLPQGSWSSIGFRVYGLGFGI